MVGPQEQGHRVLVTARTSALAAAAATDSPASPATRTHVVAAVELQEQARSALLTTAISVLGAIVATGRVARSATQIFARVHLVAPPPRDPLAP